MSRRGHAQHPIGGSPKQTENVHDDDSHIFLAEPIPMRVSEGEYEAICLSVKRVPLDKWKREALFFCFQIKELGPADGVKLRAYVNLGSSQKKKITAPSPSSKLGRWWRTLLSFDPSLNCQVVSTKAFKEFLFRVRVTNVRQDNRQQAVPEAGQCQVVTEIVSVLGRLAIQ